VTIIMCMLLSSFFLVMWEEGGQSEFQATRHFFTSRMGHTTLLTTICVQKA
jgi:hypothetical protein